MSNQLSHDDAGSDTRRRAALLRGDDEAGHDCADPGQLLLSPVQAANRLGIGRSTLYLLLADGQVESVHIGARQLVPVEGLRLYVERLRRGLSAATPVSGTLRGPEVAPRPTRRRNQTRHSQPTLPLST